MGGRSIGGINGYSKQASWLNRLVKAGSLTYSRMAMRPTAPTYPPTEERIFQTPERPSPSTDPEPAPRHRSKPLKATSQAPKSPRKGPYPKNLREAVLAWFGWMAGLMPRRVANGQQGRNCTAHPSTMWREHALVRLSGARVAGAELREWLTRSATNSGPGGDQYRASARRSETRRKIEASRRLRLAVAGQAEHAPKIASETSGSANR